MYQLLLKQKFRFIIRMVKRNISVYIALAVVLPGMVFLESVMRDILGMNIALLIPYGILCYLFMNLFSSIPRIRISPENYIWKIEKAYIWRIKAIAKSVLLTFGVTAAILLCFPMENTVLRQFLVVMLFNPLVNIHTVMSTQYKYKDLTNMFILTMLLICFFYGLVGVAGSLLILYGVYFIVCPYFSYQSIITFFQQYNQILYGFLNREYDTVLQTQDEMFFQSRRKELPHLMRRAYGNRYCLLMAYEVISVIRRKKQTINQYFAIALISMLLSQIDGKGITYILLFFILVIGQNVVNYNMQKEVRVVKKGFRFLYSLGEKILCKSGIGILLMLFPMICYWVTYKIEIFSIVLWIWTPIQCIIMNSAKNKFQRYLYMLPFYILSILSMGLWRYMNWW